MSNYVPSRLERLYLTMESPTAYGVAVAPTNSNACRLIKASMDNINPVLERRDKFGSFTPPAGVKGRVSGKWSFEASLVNGTSGVPDADPLFQLLFSNAPTGGVYTLAKNQNVSANLWDYRDPSTAAQRVALGAVMTQAQINLGQDIAEWTCEGECRYVLNSLLLPNISTVLSMLSSSDLAAAKGGLVTFPSEPGSPVTHGNIIAGFTGQLTVAGNVLATVQTATIKIVTGVELVKDTFGTYFPQGLQRVTRKVTFAFTLYEDDSAGQEAIYEAAESKTPIEALCQIGTVAQNTFTFDVKGIQLDSPSRDDSNPRFKISYPDSVAHGTSSGEDELSLTVS